MAAAKMMHQTKVTILLSLNAVVILIVGVMIFSAINLNGGLELRLVDARNDVVGGSLEEPSLLAPGLEEMAKPITPPTDTNPSTPSGSGSNSGANYQGGGSSGSTGGVSSGSVPSGQLWSEEAITIYQTADFDICVGGGLTDLGDMYWQSSNQSVIAGFYNAARTWLGFNSATCRYPVIVGTGTTTVKAGTYDGRRYDTLTVTVIAPPIEQWKRDVLTLVNRERSKNGLAALSWGTACEGAANLRARELKTSYSHTRPDGSSWSTACTNTAAGGKMGENLAVGNSAVSPETVVASWMGSPEHRKNILDPDFKYLSVGFVFDPNSQHKTYWSQWFTTF